LSGDGSLACASCHNPSTAFTDGRAVAQGINGQAGTRNSPTLINAAFGASFFWDGRARTIEEQVLQPIYNPKEMGSSEVALERATGMKAYDVAAALASYVRTIRSTDSPYDQYQRGNTSALTTLEKAGLDLFRGKANCAGCHAGANFSDGQFHNTGEGYRDGRLIDEGRFAVTQNPRDRGAFKTPTLREIALTGPYMHDGALATLYDVVNFYDEGGRRNPNLDPRVRPLGLSSGEKAALVAFLNTLSGKVTAGTY
jgi:cytochrome c peroxidase